MDLGPMCDHIFPYLSTTYTFPKRTPGTIVPWIYSSVQVGPNGQEMKSSLTRYCQRSRFTSNGLSLVRADRISHWLVRTVQTDASQMAALRNLKALPITETELRLIAAAATIGLKRISRNGYNRPAAMGTPAEL